MAQQTMGAFTEEKVDRSVQEPAGARAGSGTSGSTRSASSSSSLSSSPRSTRSTQGSPPFDPAQFSVAPPNEVLDLRTHFEGYLTGKETNIILQGNSTTIHVDLDESLREERARGHEHPRRHRQEGGPDARPVRDKLAKSNGEKYAAFNNAFFNSGTFIHVPEGSRSRLPFGRCS